MTLVRIDAPFASGEQLLGLSSAVRGVVEKSMKAEETKYVHILHGHGDGVVLFDRESSNSGRDAGFVVVQIFLSRESTVAERESLNAQLRSAGGRVGFKSHNLALSIVNGSPSTWFPGD